MGVIGANQLQFPKVSPNKGGGEEGVLGEERHSSLLGEERLSSLRAVGGEEGGLGDTQVARSSAAVDPMEMPRHNPRAGGLGEVQLSRSAAVGARSPLYAIRASPMLVQSFRSFTSSRRDAASVVPEARPSTHLARERNRHRIGLRDDDGNAFPLGMPMHELGRSGIGIELYFRTLGWVGWLFTAAAVLGVGLMVDNASRPADPVDGLMLSVALGFWGDTERPLPTSSAVLQAGIWCAIDLLAIGLLFWLRRREFVVAREADFRFVTTADFSVELRGLPAKRQVYEATIVASIFPGVFPDDDAPRPVPSSPHVRPASPFAPRPFSLAGGARHVTPATLSGQTLHADTQQIPDTLQIPRLDSPGPHSPKLRAPRPDSAGRRSPAPSSPARSRLAVEWDAVELAERVHAFCQQFGEVNHVGLELF
ncbi:hypothetical protein T492DRAFT_846773 [Pavlovales sp. CCMP2436]|nr:hypothetical protein T492DRAFT_846773 [Pavlovales sp. CCMP2436]